MSNLKICYPNKDIDIVMTNIFCEHYTRCVGLNMTSKLPKDQKLKIFQWKTNKSLFLLSTDNKEVIETFFLKNKKQV